MPQPRLVDADERCPLAREPPPPLAILSPASTNRSSSGTASASSRGSARLRVAAKPPRRSACATIVSDAATSGCARIELRAPDGDYAASVDRGASADAQPGAGTQSSSVSRTTSAPAAWTPAFRAAAGPDPSSRTSRTPSCASTTRSTARVSARSVVDDDDLDHDPLLRIERGEAARERARPVARRHDDRRRDVVGHVRAMTGASPPSAVERDRERLGLDPVGVLEQVGVARRGSSAGSGRRARDPRPCAAC